MLCVYACVCVYPRPSSRLPVNCAKLVSSRKLRGDEGGDVSHLMVALSTSTGDWKNHKSNSVQSQEPQLGEKNGTDLLLLANSLLLSCGVSSSRLAIKQNNKQLDLQLFKMSKLLHEECRACAL